MEEKPIISVPSTDFLAMFDEQFSIREIGQALEEADQETETTIATAKEAYKDAFVNNSGQDEYKYVAKIDDKIQEAIDNGDMRIDITKDGKVMAQLRDKNGHYGEKLPLEKELQEKGLTAEELKLALQMEAIKDLLQTVIDNIAKVEKSVVEVLNGQHNDRVGLFYSGLSLLGESAGIQDENLKKLITTQALKAFSDANSQMIQEMKANVEFLIEEQYKKAKQRTKEIENHLNATRECFAVIYRATVLKAMIYQQSGELDSMLTVLSEYGRLIDNLIVPYVGKLHELDKDSLYIDTSIWNTIAHTLEGCNEIRKKLGNGETYYLGQGEIINGN